MDFDKKLTLGDSGWIAEFILNTDIFASDCVILPNNVLLQYSQKSAFKNTVTFLLT